HARSRAQQAEIAQRLECAQRVGVELALVVDAAHPRALDEVVGQNLVPQVDDLLALREEPMPTDVEAVAPMLDRTADPADVGRVLLDDRDGLAGPGQQVPGCEPRRAGADDRYVDGEFAASRTVRHARISPAPRLCRE